MSLSNNADITGVRVAAIAILCVLAVFLIVLLIGKPITTFGNKEMSFLYGILVFVPVASICLYTITRKTKSS
ncbi:MAG TPA: hypothetical protein VNE86_05695 [Nitrososphaerales archaeon]|nr:hypothetical protein [Nitrososphaerales archaeon]